MIYGGSDLQGDASPRTEESCRGENCQEQSRLDAAVPKDERLGRGGLKELVTPKMGVN